MRTGPFPYARIVLTATSLLLLVSGAAVAATDTRLTGTVVDEGGSDVDGLTLRLVPGGGAGNSPIDVEIGKKGRFAIPAVPNGQWAPSIAEPGWAIAAVKFVARGPDRVKVAEFEEVVDPGEGIPGFVAQPLLRAQLEITIRKVELVDEMGDAAALEKAKDDSPILLELNALFEAGEWQALVDKSAEVVAEHPDLGGAFYLRAVGLWRVGDLGAASEAMRRAAELAPDQPGVQGTLGTLLLERARTLQGEGETEEAKGLFSEAADLLAAQLEATPDSPTYLTNRVVALEGAGRVDEAVAAIEALIAADPENPKPYFRLAEIHMDAGRLDDAIAVLDRMPKGDAAGAALLYNAAVEFWNAGNADATIATVDKALEIDPELADLYRLKGRALISKGEMQQGVEVLRTYLSMIPEDDPSGDTERQLVEALGGGGGAS